VLIIRNLHVEHLGLFRQSWLTLSTLHPSLLPEFARISNAKAWLSAGGDLAWISLPTSAAHELSESLSVWT
jgi:hypothetical protein